MVNYTIILHVCIKPTYPLSILSLLDKKISFHQQLTNKVSSVNTIFNENYLNL